MKPLNGIWTMRHSFFICVICGVFISLICGSGCGPTYKDKGLEQAIVRLCKKDSNIDVKAKRVGKTLGIYVPVGGLFESTAALKQNMTLDELFTGIKFTKEAADKIEAVSLVLSRVALSTDADVDFYVLILADTKGTGIQIVVTRYIKDMKRVMLGDVSRGDYFQRLLMDVSFDPVGAAKETVKRFFYDMQRLPADVLASRYFSKVSDVKASSPDFFLYLAELDYKRQRLFSIIDSSGIQVEKGKVLVKCRVRETYVPLAGYENFNFTQPSGSENEYIILLETLFMPYLIEQVFSAKAPYPEQFVKYQDLQVWLDQDFFLKEITMPDFLAKQLATRVRNLYQSDIRLRDEFLVNVASGEYQPRKRAFKIIVDIENKKTGRGVSRQRINFNQMWEIISQTLRRYDFKDYDTVELFNISDARKEVMARADLINKFWPKWLLRR
jgi:hypothetical protein